MRELIVVKLVVLTFLLLALGNSIADGTGRADCAEQRTRGSSISFQFVKDAIQSKNQKWLANANACLWSKFKTADAASVRETATDLLMLADASPRVFIASIPSEEQFERYLGNLTTVLYVFDKKSHTRMERMRHSLAKRLIDVSRSSNVPEVATRSRRMSERLLSTEIHLVD